MIMVGVIRLFLSNCSQAVRIPADLRLPESVHRAVGSQLGQILS